jgi:amino acid adenylation domain-containing protein
LQILTHEQQGALLEIGTGTRGVVLDSNKTFINFFKDWVIKTPDSVAIHDNKSQLTYDELDKRSNAVAAYLNKAVSDQEGTIGVVLSRSINTIVILLGVLKLGKAYIPLDPTFPLERLKYIVSHSKTKTLICDNQFSFFDTKDITILNTETVLSDSINEVVSESRKLPKSKDTAYIIYTSGSTGNPKGVEIDHSSLMNFLLSIKERLEIQPKDLLYAVTTYSFDISILEFFVPLISGASVFIANNESLIDAQKIIKDIETIEPSIIQATPSFYQLLFNAGWTGDKKIKVLCGGDSLSVALASQLLSLSKELWNMYGPTETTIWSSIKHIKQSEEASNIGSAIDNTSLFVLGEHRELLPKGAQGILYIGGDGLAKGYYKDKKLTEQRFIKNPYKKGLLYETGDIVKWNTENELVFFGRNDHQVKVRGYRIELGDIEAKLNAIEEISQVIVIVKKDTLEEAVLVAFYSSSQLLKTADIKKRLREALPDYMIPSQFIRLDKFPLTPNKKIDRKALFQIDFNKDVQKEYKAPTTEIEKELLTLWKEYFELEKISINDNFFDLGGHSLTATKLVSRIQEEFSIKLSINNIFEYATIEQQAQIIENLQLLSHVSKEDNLETEFENYNI